MRGNRGRVGAGLFVLVVAAVLVRAARRSTVAPAVTPTAPLAPPPSTLPSRVPAPVETQLPDRPPRRRRRLLALAVVLVLVAAGYGVARVLPGNDTRRPVLADTERAGAATSAPTLQTPTLQTPTRTTPSVGFVPARTFLWAARRGASGYVVTLLHDGVVVLRRRVHAPRLQLPAGFDFEAGRYRWTVWALPRTPHEVPQTNSEFVLSAASAAAANRH